MLWFGGACIFGCPQIHEEKLVYWNMAVRDFSILINLIKVCMETPWPISLADCRNQQGSWFPNGLSLPCLGDLLSLSSSLVALPPRSLLLISPGDTFFLLSLPPPHLCHNSFYLMAPCTYHSPTLPPLIMNPLLSGTYSTISLFQPWMPLLSLNTLCSHLFEDFAQATLRAYNIGLPFPPLIHSFLRLQINILNLCDALFLISHMESITCSFLLPSSFSRTLIMMITLFFVINLTVDRPSSF